MSLKTTILSVTRRTKNGFTVGEIFDRLAKRSLLNGTTVPTYSAVRARVYELASAGSLVNTGARKDSRSGCTASAFRHSDS